MTVTAGIDVEWEDRQLDVAILRTCCIMAEVAVIDRVHAPESQTLVTRFSL